MDKDGKAAIVMVGVGLTVMVITVVPVQPVAFVPLSV
jgi:hypothetical protein